jgi:RNA polymerase sigma factor (sigma-70 family)
VAALEPDGEEPDRPSETDLVADVRAGDLTAFGALYRRHAPAAERFVRRLMGTAQDAEDVVAEAFAKILQRLVAGGGPTAGFRPYLFATVRTTLYKHVAANRMFDQNVEVGDGSLVVLDDDVVLAQLEMSLAARAYDSLPERWRLVLRHLDLECASTAMVAELLGIRANAVSALAFRAREALRVAYLQMHVNTDVAPECQESARHMAAWCCGRLTRARRARVDVHVLACAHCANVAAELADLLAGLRRVAPAALAIRRLVPVQAKILPRA